MSGSARALANPPAPSGRTTPDLDASAPTHDPRPTDVGPRRAHARRKRAAPPLHRSCTGRSRPPTRARPRPSIARPPRPGGPGVQELVACVESDGGPEPRHLQIEIPPAEIPGNGVPRQPERMRVTGPVEGQDVRALPEPIPIAAVPGDEHSTARAPALAAPLLADGAGREIERDEVVAVDHRHPRPHRVDLAFVPIDRSPDDRLPGNEARDRGFG